MLVDSWVQVFKVVGFEAFAPQGAAPGFEFPPDSRHAGCGVYGEIVFPAPPTRFHAGLLLLAQCTEILQPVFRFFFLFVYFVLVFSPRGNCFICSCRFSAFVGGSDSKFSSVLAMLNWNPSLATLHFSCFQKEFEVICKYIHMYKIYMYYITV